MAVYTLILHCNSSLLIHWGDVVWRVVRSRIFASLCLIPSVYVQFCEGNLIFTLFPSSPFQPLSTFVLRDGLKLDSEFKHFKLFFFKSLHFVWLKFCFRLYLNNVIKSHWIFPPCFEQILISHQRFSKSNLFKTRIVARVGIYSLLSNKK